MTDDLQELLSAYLDGELTSDEQARVEQQLAENSEYRQLYDELRALRTSLEVLPRHRLHDDISRSVLRKAERTILSGQRNGSHSNGKSTDQAAEAAPAKVERQWRVPSRRAVIYPAIALAACLLIMFFTRPQQPGEEIANIPPAKKPDDNLLVGPSTVEAQSTPGKAPATGNPAEPSRAPESENTPPAVPDPRAIVGTHRGGNTPKTPVEPTPPITPPGPSNDLVKVDADLDKPPLERALTFANEINKPLAGAIMIVRCQATQAALDSGAIDVILNRHDLTITTAGEKPAAGEKSVELPKVSPELDLVYLETTALEAAAILAELQAENHHFLKIEFGLAPEEAQRGNQVLQQPQVSNARLEENRGNATQAVEQAPKEGKPDAKQTTGEANPVKPQVAEAKEPWTSRAHRLRLGTAKEKEKTAVVGRKHAAPTEPVVRVLFLLRAVEAADKK